jgi:hypothetical protein
MAAERYDDLTTSCPSFAERIADWNALDLCFVIHNYALYGSQISWKVDSEDMIMHSSLNPNTPTQKSVNPVIGKHASIKFQN